MSECKLVNRKADGLPPLRVMSILAIPIAIGKEEQNKAIELVGYILPVPLLLFSVATEIYKEVIGDLTRKG